MSEQRLIDATVLIDEINGQKNVRADSIMYGWYSDMVKSQPTIDPETLPLVQELRAELAERVPVYAHWEPFSKNENRGYRCSHCKKARISNSDYYSTVYRNYCYNCGAKMGKEDKNEI